MGYSYGRSYHATGLRSFLELSYKQKSPTRRECEASCMNVSKIWLRHPGRRTHGVLMIPRSRPYTIHCPLQGTWHVSPGFMSESREASDGASQLGDDVSRWVRWTTAGGFLRTCPVKAKHRRSHLRRRSRADYGDKLPLAAA